MKVLGKTVTVILLSIFFVGLSVLLYPAVSQYWNTRVQSKTVTDYARLMETVTPEDSSAIREQAEAYNRQLAALDSPLMQWEQIPGYADTLLTAGSEIMGTVAIDKIQVELPIYHGTSSAVLDRACGHLEGSSLPIGGPGSHCVLSAHRGLPNATLFTHLDKLEIGDTFALSVLGEVLTYQVDQIKLVLPYEISDLAIEEGEDYCTLVTCAPYGINTHRMLVRGTRIETTKTRTATVTSDAYLVDRLIVAPAVALPILFVLILIVMFQPPKRKSQVEEEEELL